MAAPRFYLYDYLLEAGKQTVERVAIVLGAIWSRRLGNRGCGSDVARCWKSEVGISGMLQYTSRMVGMENPAGIWIDGEVAT